MSDRKLYEVAIRVGGMIILWTALGTLVSAISLTLEAQDVPEFRLHALMTSVRTVLGIAVGVGLVALGPRISAFFARGTRVEESPPALSSQAVVHVGIILIGVYLIATGIPALLEGILSWIANNAGNRIVWSGGGASAVLVYGSRAVIGVLLAMHERILRHLRRIDAPSREQNRRRADSDSSERPDDV